MSSSDVSCTNCGKALGEINGDSKIFHPGAGVEPTYVDHGKRITTFRCPKCRHTTNVRAARVDLTALPP